MLILRGIGRLRERDPLDKVFHRRGGLGFCCVGPTVLVLGRGYQAFGLGCYVSGLRPFGEVVGSTLGRRDRGRDGGTDPTIAFAALGDHGAPGLEGMEGPAEGMEGPRKRWRDEPHDSLRCARRSWGTPAEGEEGPAEGMGGPRRGWRDEAHNGLRCAWRSWGTRVGGCGSGGGGRVSR